MTTAKLLALLLAFVASACMALPPVRVEATRADYERLAGKWHGEYSSAALGRRGSIDFELTAATNKASGVVVMVPQGSTRPYEQYGPLQYQYGGQNPSPSQAQTIYFVRAEGTAISGMLDRYWDPDRSCFASTTFRAVLEGRTMAGSFKTTWDCGAGEATGDWKVTRKN